MPSELALVRAMARRTAARLWWLDATRAARALLDIPRFGTDPTERMAAALVAGGVFFLIYLGIATVAGLGVKVGLTAGIVGLGAVLMVSAVMVVGRSDESIRAARVAAAASVSELKIKRAELAVIESERAAAEKAARAVAAAEDRTMAMRGGGTLAGPAPVYIPRPPRKRMVLCPYCDEAISAEAVKCHHCGEILDERLRRSRLEPRFNPGVAAVLSFFWPGVGQIYKGQVLNGFVWMFVVAVGYLSCFVPGVVLHLFCVIGASMGGRD